MKFKLLTLVLPAISFVAIANSAAAQCSNTNDLLCGASNETLIDMGSDTFGDDTVMNFTTGDTDQPQAAAPTCENGGLPAEQCPVQE